MAKKIRFPLEMKDGVMVRTLEELIQNFDLEKILSHAEDGKLETWLRDRYYEEMADRVKEIRGKDDKAAEAVCSLFQIPAAFSQEELQALLDKGADTIYLYGTKFEIPVQKPDVTYIGLNHPDIIVHAPEEPVEWEKRNITVLGCNCEDYDTMLKCQLKYREEEQECRKFYNNLKNRYPGIEYGSFEELYGAAKEIYRIVSNEKQGRE